MATAMLALQQKAVSSLTKCAYNRNSARHIFPSVARQPIVTCRAFGSGQKPHRRSLVKSRKTTHICKAAETASYHKLISRAEVPAFIMRDDLIDQLFRWVSIETGDDCVKNFGLPMSVDTIMKDVEGQEVLWGFLITVFREGTKVAELAVQFDEDSAQKFEWIDRGSDGMPVSGGKAASVLGKNLEFWKVDDSPVDDDIRSALKAVCGNLIGALNKYYSFGSVFAEDI